MRADISNRCASLAESGREHHSLLAPLTTCLITEHVRTCSGSSLFPAARKRSSRGSRASFNDSSKGKSAFDKRYGGSNWKLRKDD
jgi:hypothetical protein